MTLTSKTILMMDIETLGTDSNAVVWQTALYAVDATDPASLLDYPHHAYLPIAPQLSLLPARKIDASTMLYWMQDELAPARTMMTTECDSEDFDELTSTLRHFLRAFDRYTNSGLGDYELWTRGNFDAPIMESLLRQSGLPTPWHFRNLRDLRTLEATSGVSYKTVAEPQGFIKHRADWDAMFQLSHYAECMKALGQGAA